MAPKAFKIINGSGIYEIHWAKIKEAVIIGVGVSLLTAAGIGAVSWATNDRVEIKNDLKMLMAGQKVQEHNAATIAARVGDNTVLLYKHLDPKWPCPEPIVLEKFWLDQQTSKK